MSRSRSHLCAWTYSGCVILPAIAAELVAIKPACGVLLSFRRVEREIELQHIDPLLAENAEEAVFGRVSD